MIKKRVVINLFLIISLIAFISANFEIGNLSHSIDTTYGPKGDVKGWINISLDNEKSNSVFEDSEGNSISLIKLINKNKDFEYNCSTANCSIPDYSANNGQATKTFNLESRQSAIIGLKFSGEISSIDSVDFFIDSDASSGCYNQIKLDFLDDGSIDRGNNKASFDSCSFLKDYGCFNETENLYHPTITTIPYCQRVNVFESPGLKLGAWVLEESAGDNILTMALYDLYGDLKKSCKLTKTGISSGNEISCDVEYLTTESKDYYVCIYSDSGTGTYKTKGYSESSNCGFNGFPVKSETNSYQIFAQAKAFAAVGTVNISNSLFNGNTLGGIVSNYIFETYGSLDCSHDCIVPIRLTSGKNQQITIRNLKAVYNKPGLKGLTENQFYNLSEISPVIDADFQKLFLDNGGFSLPSDYGSLDFELSFNNEKIFEESIFIQEIPIIGAITPTVTASAFPTIFKVNVHSANELIKYEWNFGDNSTEITTTNSVTHIYDSMGKYTLKVTVVDSLQRSVSKNVQITVGSSKEIINTTLARQTENLQRINKQIKKFDFSTQKILNSVLDIDTLDSELKKIKKEYDKVSFEEEYSKVLTDLLKLNIPESILTTKNANSISSFPKEDYIDLYILETIGEGTYDIDDEDKYINSIIFWNQKNIDTKITFKEISARYSSFDEPLLNIFELDITEKDSLEDNPYFIIKNIENLEFQEDYLQNKESGYVYIELTKPEKIVFYTTEDVDFTNLPFFISPAINRLSIDKIPSVQEEESFSKWIFFILLIFFLAIIGIIVYVILQVWYKNKYEDYLFKNKNHLYNLITYIENSRKKELKDSEISKKLKKAGWKSEQINYVLKKHSGKRTGMFEIPIGKVVKKIKGEDKKPVNKVNRNLGYDKRFR